MSAQPAIDFLIAPVALQEFFASFWGKTFLHLQRQSAGYYQDILKVEEIDAYFQSETLHPSFLRMLRSGKDIPLEQWTRIEKRQNTDLYRVVDNAKLFSLFGDGVTVILNSAERAVPRLTSFCNRLERDLRTRLQANIYITPPHEVGFDTHHDSHDLFVLQISGKKLWRLYDCAGSSDLNKASDPVIELEMRAGDLLYLPENLIHEVNTVDEPSVHITLGVYARRWFHLVKEMAAVAEGSPDFQRALPLQFASDQQKEEFTKEFLDKLNSLIAVTDTPTLLENENVVFVGEQLAIHSGRFIDLLKVSELRANSILIRREGIDYLIETRSDNLILKFGRQELSFSHILGPALKSLLTDKPFAVRDIGGLIPESGKLKLASDLVRAGFLTILSL